MTNFEPGELGKTELLIHYASLIYKELSFPELVSVESLPEVIFLRYNLVCIFGFVLHELNLNHTSFKEDVLGKQIRDKIAAFLLSCVDSTKGEKEVLDEIWTKRSEAFKLASKDEFLQTYHRFSLILQQTALRSLSCFVASPYFIESAFSVFKIVNYFFTNREEELRLFARDCLQSYLTTNVTTEKLINAVHKVKCKKKRDLGTDVLFWECSAILQNLLFQPTTFGLSISF